MKLQGTWDLFLDIVYPRDIRCDICSAKRDDILNHGVCEDCESRLPFIEPPVCPKCGKMMLADNKLCSDCEKISHAFYKGISIFEFSAEVKRLIHRYKYKGEKQLSIPMIHWMTEALKYCRWDFDTIVSVPLYPTRERERGFNQAGLLAKGLSGNMGVVLANKTLFRVKDTPHQARLGRQERLQNLMDAFEVRKMNDSSKVFQGKTILLVDDVYTTGSTVDQCARVLLESGAKGVYVITLATGSNF